jgi:molybdopterin-guanine dinucleotide biosynthesis protein A
MADYSIAIQAGGASVRMGQDKGLLPFGRATLTDYILDQVEGLTSDLFVVSNDPQSYARYKFPVFMDVIPDIGALGGIFTVLNYLQYDYVLILACDMPFVSRPLLDHAAGFLKDYDVVIPVSGEKQDFEPFRAFYSKRCLKSIQQAISLGKRRVISFFPDVRVKVIDSSTVTRFDPEAVSFINVNTPEELAKARARAAAP